jgi:hypothetical protein
MSTRVIQPDHSTPQAPTHGRHKPTMVISRVANFLEEESVIIYLMTTT